MVKIENVGENSEKLQYSYIGSKDLKYFSHCGKQGDKFLG
jgi:hypothetical protein